MAIIINSIPITITGNASINVLSAAAPSTPTLIQSKTGFNTTNTTSPAIAWNSTPTPGSLLLLAINSDALINSVSGWTLAVGAADYCATSIYYKTASASEPLGITASISVSDVAQFAAYEYSGFSIYPSLDASGSRTGQATSNLIRTNTNASTTTTQQFAFAVVGSDTGSYIGSVSSWSDSFTALDSQTATGQTVSITMATSYKLLSSTGIVSTTASFSGPNGTSHDVGIIATFKY
jgi:hypothetical protein